VRRRFLKAYAAAVEAAGVAACDELTQELYGSMVDHNAAAAAAAGSPGLSEGSPTEAASYRSYSVSMDRVVTVRAKEGFNQVGLSMWGAGSLPPHSRTLIEHGV